MDSGTEVYNVICGAPNVSEGQIVPFAKPGAKIGSEKLKSVKIRGVRSDGMICSEKELGLSDDHSGIMVLNETEWEPGQEFNPVLDNDTVFVINITPNRPDCLSHIGVAREVAAITGAELKIPETQINETDVPVEEKVEVEIQDPEGCPRYCVRVIENIEIKESPLWLKKRLEAVGVRSINNVVDITNYVLMETGHPLHAFDYDFIEGHKIVVRKANDNEKFVTLDNIERQLVKSDLLICDGKKPVALAGVMGGLNSEVINTTKTVLLESAYFDPMTIRRTAKRLNLSTEASYRFERGADPENAVYAVNRAADLMEKLAGGKTAKGFIDNNPRQIKPWNVDVRVDRVNFVLGTNIPKDKIVSIFKSLKLKVKDGTPLNVEIPTFRPDLKREIDLIEEVIRLYGFDVIEPSMSTVIPLNEITNKKIKFHEDLRDYLAGIGFNEVINTSMVSLKHIEILKNNLNIDAVKIKNPLSPETEYIRTSLIPGVLDSVKWNHNRATSDIHLFEIGRAMYAKNKSLPDEYVMACGAVSGRKYDKVTWKRNSEPVDFYYLKGIIEYIFAKFHIYDYFLEDSEYPFFNDNSAQKIIVSGNTVGYMGKVGDGILKKWDINTDVYMFDLNLDSVFGSVRQRIVYSPIPRFPAVKRDLAIVVDESVRVRQIIDKVKSKGGKYLKQVEIFDLYKGKQIPEGKKSIALTMTFLSDEKTLREQEIEPVFKKIIAHLEAEFSASLRSV